MMVTYVFVSQRERQWFDAVGHRKEAEAPGASLHDGLEKGRVVVGGLLDRGDPRHLQSY